MMDDFCNEPISAPIYYAACAKDTQKKGGKLCKYAEIQAKKTVTENFAYYRSQFFWTVRWRRGDADISTLYEKYRGGYELYGA